MWEVDGVVNEGLVQRALRQELRVGAGPRGFQLHPLELVVTIDKDKKHDGVVPLVVVVGAASIEWSLDADVLPIEGTSRVISCENRSLFDKSIKLCTVVDNHILINFSYGPIFKFQNGRHFENMRVGP